MNLTTLPAIETQLKAAIRAILGQDTDRATQVNGVGFNKFDSDPMEDLYYKGPWSPKQAHYAWRTMRKYRGQLSGHGIEFDAIPEPQVPKDEPRAAQGGPSIEIKNGTAFIKFPFKELWVEKVRMIEGREWWGIDKTWRVNLAKPQSIAGLERFAQETGAKLPVELDSLKLRSVELAKKQLEQDAQRDAEDADRVKDSMATQADFHVEGLGGELMPFQRAGVKYAVDAKRCLIADEMGLGKTVQALASLQHMRSFPALVICPASLKLNWIREARKWLPAVDVQLWTPNIATLFDNGTYHPAIRRIRIINYDVLGKHKDEILKTDWKAIVMDECHYMKNHKSQRSQAAKEICKKREVILGLTGTPILNRPGELFHQIQLLGRVNDVGGFKEFQKKYLGYDWKGDGQHLQELQKIVRSKFLIRREKKDVLKDLPAKQRAEIDIELTDRAAYEKVRTAPMEDTEAAALVRLGQLRREAARQKLAGIKEWVTEFLETGKKLVLFATHRDIQAQLVEAFPGCLQILGDDNIKARQEAVDRFQEDQSIKLIVCSLKAAGVGLTLTAASDVAFAEFGWTPADMDQAEDRCHRIGQQDSVTAWYLRAPRTVDENMLALIEGKRAIAKQLLESGQMPKIESGEGELVKSILSEAREAGRVFAKA